jgi:hypothetical protein
MCDYLQLYTKPSTGYHTTPAICEECMKTEAKPKLARSASRVYDRVQQMAITYAFKLRVSVIPGHAFQ